MNYEVCAPTVVMGEGCFAHICCMEDGSAILRRVFGDGWFVVNFVAWRMRL